MTKFDTRGPIVDRRTAIAGLAGTALTPWAQAGDHGFEVIHAFTGGDGSPPTGALLAADDGRLYGTTSMGEGIYRFKPN